MMVVLKKEAYHQLTLTLSKIVFLSVYGLCVLFIYTIFISTLGASEEGLGLVESNQQI